MSLKLKGALILLTVLELLASPRIASASQDHSPQEKKSFQKPYGGTLIIGHNNVPTIINPIVTDTSVSVSIATLVFDRVVQYDSQGRIQKNLADSWKMSEDGLTYTFFLKQGVKFHDGVELTSEDVLYTYKKVLDPENRSPYMPNLTLVEKFDVPDRYTIRVRLKKPSSSFIYQMTREIVPRHLYEKEDLHLGSFNVVPIGTGPFKIKHSAVKDRIILEANPDYFQGRPYLDRIIYKYFPSRADVWSAFMRGEVNVVIFLSIEDFELVKRDPSFKVFGWPSSDYYVISYNLNSSLWKNSNVRKAIAHAIDRNELIKIVEKGYGVERAGPFHSGLEAFDEGVKPFPYNPHEAIKLLKISGWDVEDKTGLLKNKDGEYFIVRVLVDDGNSSTKKMIALIRQQLQQIGIRLEVVLSKQSSPEDVQAYLTLIPGDVPDPSETIKTWKSMDRRRGSIWRENRLDPKIDELIMAAENAQDPAAQKIFYYDFQRLIYEEQPVCFLYSPYIFNAVSRQIQGIDPYLASQYMPDYALKDVYINNSIKGGDRNGDYSPGDG